MGFVGQNVGGGRGFTLLEVMISLALLAFLTLFATQSLQRAISSKNRTQQKLDRHSGLKSALDIMAYDLSRAFNYRSLQVELHNKVQKARKARDQKKKKKKKKDEKGKNRDTQSDNSNQDPGADPNQDPDRAPNSDPENPDKAEEPQDREPAQNDPTPPREYKLKKDKIITSFMGTADSVNFSSLSYMRSQINEAASDQAEIGYFVRECKGRFKKSESSKCLWRRMSAYIDDDISQGGTETVLLENIESLELKYLGGQTEKPTWVDAWDSKKPPENCATGGGGEWRTFPQAVSIRLEQNIKEADHSTSMHQVVQLRFANNRPCNNKGG